MQYDEMQSTDMGPQVAVSATVVLRGMIARVLQEQADNGHAVMFVETETGTVRVSGSVPFPMPGERLEAHGWWEGMNFQIARVVRSLPEGEAPVRKFLEDLTLRTIGRVTLHRLVARFGGDSLEIFLEDPLRLSEIPGLPPDRALAASEELRLRLACRDAAQWMVQFGISPVRAEIAAKRYGLQAASWLSENPYRLLEPVLGASFAEVDQAAMAHGMGPFDRRRLEAATEWLLRRAQDEGHVCLPESVLFYQVNNLLGTYPQTLPQTLPQALENAFEPEPSTTSVFESEASTTSVFEPEHSAASVFEPETPTTTTFTSCKDSAAFLDAGLLPGAVQVGSPDPGCLVYTTNMLLLETRVAQRLHALLALEPHRSFQLSPADWIALETLAPWGWDDGQRKVFADAGAHGVTVVTGGPGTGKTTLIKGLVQVFADRELEVVLTAPTGRAARRMSDATGLEAKTVHRLLEVAYDVEGTDTLRFRRGSQDPLEAEVVILDEASMLDLPLFAALLDACADGTRLILVGDAEQLPSVGAGRVLGDLIDSEAIPMTRLGQVFRQSDGSRIAANAQAILRGRAPEFSDEWGEFHLVRRFRNTQIADAVVRLCRDELPERYGFDPLTDIQVLSPMRKGSAGTVQLNALLREALNPPVASAGAHGQFPGKKAGILPFREGDRVMQNRNEYRQAWVWQDAGRPPVPGEGVYNGDMGTVVEIDTRSRSAIVVFDDGRESRYDFRQLDGLELAYAVTVHKSQGSEYPVVVLVLGAMPDSLACRNLLYTAITRARRMVVIVGTETTLARMIQNNRNLTRYSGLALRLGGQLVCTSAPPKQSASAGERL